MPEPFLHLSAADRGDALEAAALQASRPAGLLEKDVWVVWTLKTLFQAEFGSSLTFKGGTSLSKVYGVIDRFSEDVDLTYDIRSLLPEFAEVDGDPIPGSRSAAERLSRKAREALRDWVREVPAPALREGLVASGVDGAEVQVEGSDLFLSYPHAIPQASEYMKPRVLVEFGARSSGEPASPADIICDAAPFLPELDFPAARPRVMAAERTFWEKATAAHVYCCQECLRSERFARHWYDLAHLHLGGLAERALADRDLAHRVATHKSWFFRERSASGDPVDYQAAVRGELRLVPGGEAWNDLAEDYARMAESGLLPKGALDFEELMGVCARIEELANR
jgi:hypothetical protein